MLRRYLYFDPDEGTSGDPGSSDGTPDESVDDDDVSADDDPGGQAATPTRSEVAKANREAAKYRRQVRDLEAKVDKLEGDKKTELERAQDKAATAEELSNTLSAQNNILRVRILGEEVGIVREAREDAARLLDWSAIQDPSSDEEVTKALKDLVEDRPYLLGNVGAGADGGAGSDRRADSGDMNRILRAAAGR